MSHLTDKLCAWLILIAVVYLILQRSCGEPNGNPDKSDTVYVQGTPDTVIIHDTTFKEVMIPVSVKSYLYIRDTVELSTSSRLLPDLTCDTIRVYVDSIEDGTCKVIVKDSVRGELLGWSAELYSKDMTITRVDTMKITTIPDRLRIAVGMGYSNQPFPYVNLSRGRLNGIAGYQIKDKSLLLGVGYQIR